jgi:hypothetical protein
MAVVPWSMPMNMILSFAVIRASFPVPKDPYPFPESYSLCSGMPECRAEKKSREKKGGIPAGKIRP